MSERMTPEERAEEALDKAFCAYTDCVLNPDIPDIIIRTCQQNAVATAIREAVAAEKERCAGIAEGDVDWTAFGKRDLGPWENGPDSVRDYRLGIVAGRAIATAIRAEEASE